MSRARTIPKTPIAGRQSAAGPAAQRGIALVTSLLMLIVMTLLALSMFRSIGLDESIAGNTREKQRSLQSAQSALEYGEWWLGQGNGGTGNTCTTVYNANTIANMQVCTNALASPTTLPWSARGDYLPPTMTVASGGGVVSSGGNVGDVNYYAKPSLYIQYLGLDPTGKAQLYQITGAGYGGSANGASVVQSTYAVTYKNPPLDQP
ncbi:MAG: Type IV fimbrial biogenesis protein PilX [Burkholderiaceae bacterium]|jgi:type IV pilus assembly protein PilX|nr:MAG: Type IV fimbrial biogenesis protein PilX [Burkholderiaceae bacterium]